MLFFGFSSFTTGSHLISNLITNGVLGVSDLELAVMPVVDAVHDLVHQVLAMWCTLLELRKRILRDLHVDRTLLKPCLCSLVVGVPKVIIEKTHVGRTTRDRGTVQQVTRALVGLVDDEELATDLEPIAEVVLNLGVADVAKLTRRLAYNLLEILGRKVLAVLLRRKVAQERVVARCGTLGIEPYATRRIGWVTGPELLREPRTLAAVAVAHLVTNRLDDLVVVKIRLCLENDRTHLEATSCRMLVAGHLLLCRLDHGGDRVLAVVGIPGVPLDRLTAKDTRSILEHPESRLVLVGDADATSTVSNPHTRLRNNGTRAVESGERHGDEGRKKDESVEER